METPRGTEAAPVPFSDNVPPRASSQADFLKRESSILVPSMKRADLSLQIPPRHAGFGSGRKYSPHSRGPTGGFLQALSFKKKVASSDVTPASNSSPLVSTPISARTHGELQKSHSSRIGASQASISRSLSVPGRNFVIVRSLSFATPEEHVPDTGDGSVWRHVMKTILSRWSAAAKEVSNLPVTFLRVRSTSQHDNRTELNNSRRISACQDFVVLLLISTICYFFFLEQLLVHDMKTQALVIAAPFAFTLGLLASIFSVILA